jgi:hypothetical protein
MPIKTVSFHIIFLIKYKISIENIIKKNISTLMSIKEKIIRQRINYAIK